MIGSKKKRSPSTDELKLLIEPDHPELSVARQCELVGLNRSTFYYKPAEETELNLRLMRLIDEQYMKQPSWGSPRMTAWLRNTKGFQINQKRIVRLMGLMGIQGITPRRKKRTSVGDKTHQTFPYLLEKLNVNRSNQVWCSDITYIPMQRGFMYLVAIMDWHSRYVLSWELSNSLDTSFCMDALESALQFARPEIFNSDKGCQYTSSQFVNRLLLESIQPSMTGKGRCWDNIFIERLWWSVKYEDVYLKEYASGVELYGGLEKYFGQYNRERPHKALDKKTPKQVYEG